MCMIRLLEEYRLIKWLKHSDPEDYFQHGVLADDIPPELRKVFEQLIRQVQFQERERYCQRQMEFDALQSRINPHFLYNTLEAVRAKALYDGCPELEKMVHCISRFFRYSISSRGEFVCLRDEISSVQDYFVIQEFRFKNRFQLVLKIEDEEALGVHVPKMILQPIIENAVFHGLEPKRGPGTVTLRVFFSQAELHLIIEDNGVGIPESVMKQINAMLRGEDIFSSGEQIEHRGAIQNVNARLQMYFGHQYGVFIHSGEMEGTDVELVLPRQQEQQIKL